MKQSTSAMGKFIETDIEELKVELEALDLGGLSNVKNLLQLEYQKAETVKNALIEKTNSEGISSKDKKKADSLIGQMYLVLQKIEERCQVVDVLIKARRPQN